MWPVLFETGSDVAEASLELFIPLSLLLGSDVWVPMPTCPSLSPKPGRKANQSKGSFQGWKVPLGRGAHHQ